MPSLRVKEYQYWELGARNLSSRHAMAQIADVLADAFGAKVWGLRFRVKGLGFRV